MKSYKQLYKKIPVMIGFKRKDGTRTIQYLFWLPSDLNSLLTLYGNIGYAYSPKRQAQACHMY